MTTSPTLTPTPTPAPVPSADVLASATDFLPVLTTLAGASMTFLVASALVFHHVVPTLTPNTRKRGEPALIFMTAVLPAIVFLASAATGVAVAAGWRRVEEPFLAGGCLLGVLVLFACALTLAASYSATTPAAPEGPATTPAAPEGPATTPAAPEGPATTPAAPEGPADSPNTPGDAAAPVVVQVPAGCVVQVRVKPASAGGRRVRWPWRKGG